MRKRKIIKRFKISLLIIIFLSISIGYAYITSNLSIAGNTEVSANTWNIHFNNINITEGSVSEVTPTTIDPTNSTKLNYSIKLKKPGDFFEYTVDVVNSGTLNAMIDSYEATMNDTLLPDNLPPYLQYSITYLDGSDLEKNYILASNQTETIKYRIEYKTNVATEDLPTENTNLSFSLEINFIQANSDGITKPSPYYIYADNSADIDELLEDYLLTGDIYTDYNEALTNFGNVFLRYKIVNNKKINAMDLTYKYNNNTYYIIKSNNPDIYTTNKTTLINSFGSSYCTLHNENEDNETLSCTKDGYIIHASKTGSIQAEYNNWVCILANNYSYCITT